MYRTSARLIKSLGNKVGRERLHRALFILKRKVVLRIRHGTRFKPAIKDLGDPVKLFPVFFKCQVVDEVPMQVIYFCAYLLL